MPHYQTETQQRQDKTRQSDNRTQTQYKSTLTDTQPTHETKTAAEHTKRTLLNTKDHEEQGHSNLRQIEIKTSRRKVGLSHIL